MNFFDDLLFAKHQIHCPNELSTSVPKRKCSFFIGRYLAKKIFLALSEPLYCVAIGVHRQPIWPQGWLGSLSHTDNFAMVLLTKDQGKHFVGVDVEHIIQKQEAEEISSSIHSIEEASYLIDSGITSDLATSLIFSAKESLFKATYPYIKHYFGFECARITSINRQREEMSIELSENMIKYSTILKKNYTCHFKIVGTKVITYVFE